MSDIKDIPRDTYKLVRKANEQRENNIVKLYERHKKDAENKLQKRRSFL